MLPVGPPKSVVARVLQTIGPHRFQGNDLSTCSKCHQSVQADIHKVPRSGLRHAGYDHHHVSSGHVKGDEKRSEAVHRALFEQHSDTLEAPMRLAMQSFFRTQQAATLARLTGKRGKQMFKRAGYRADQPPDQPSDQNPGEYQVEPPPADAAAQIDPSSIFDKAYWDQTLAASLQPYYDMAAGLTTRRMSSTLNLPPEFDTTASTSAAKAFLAQRGNQTSPQINETTYQAIVDQLQQGVAAGEGLQALAKRIKTVFAEASDVRARRIAQTESRSALNASALAYAQALPEGRVDRKRWAAHHDDRTRPTHRETDGQTVPLDQPFNVGGSPGMYPGDPQLPPSECINCRCVLIPLAPSVVSSAAATVAAALHKSMAAKAGVTLSPEAESYLAKVG